MTSQCQVGVVDAEPNRRRAHFQNQNTFFATENAGIHRKGSLTMINEPKNTRDTHGLNTLIGHSRKQSETQQTITEEGEITPGQEVKSTRGHETAKLQNKTGKYPTP